MKKVFNSKLGSNITYTLTQTITDKGLNRTGSIHIQADKTESADKT